MEYYCFADFTLDPGRRELRRGSTSIDVQPQVFDLLLYLVQNRERVVSRDDPAVPYTADQIVSADDAFAVLHEIEQQVENLGLDVNGRGAAA